jgi:hypothetical protein
MRGFLISISFVCFGVFADMHLMRIEEISGAGSSNHQLSWNDTNFDVVLFVS